MKFYFKTNENINKHDSCLVLPVFNGMKLPCITKEFDDMSIGYISKIVNKGDLNDIDKNILLYDVPNLNYEKILLVCCGEQDNFTDVVFKKVVNNGRVLC